MEESSPSRLSLGTIFYSDVELRDQTPPYWASRSTNWRVLAGIRLTLAAAWDDTGQCGSGLSDPGNAEAGPLADGAARA